jgi:3-methylcrotonyl-CoA carboxylase alpha subunit
LGAWRLNGVAQREINLKAGEEASKISVEYGEAKFNVSLEDEEVTYAIQGELDSDGRLDANIDGHYIIAWVVRDEDFLHLFLEDESCRLKVVDPLRTAGRQVDALGGLQAPMPGTVLLFLVEPGTEVEQGTPLLIIEAMKMEHTVKAPSAGRVNGFRYAVGDQVGDGVELVDFVSAE